MIEDYDKALVDFYKGDISKIEQLLAYFGGDNLAAVVWVTKYAQEGDLTPADMHRRMAAEFARVDMKPEYIQTTPGIEHLSEYGKQLELEYEELSQTELAQRYFDLFDKFKYVIPQGSVMSQAGSKSIGSLSNCVVLGHPEDSYGGIFEKDEQAAQVMKRRCGVGLDLSSLRPVDTPTSNAAKSSTGAVSFMHRFSNTTREVAQNGRRGALMLSLDVSHPDIVDFITIKRDLTMVTGANISVKLNNAFMEAVEEDTDYILRFPTTMAIDKSIPLPDSPFIKRVQAKEVWDEIIKSAHNVAEPGLMFWGAMVDYAPDGVYPQYRAETTNPCSEIAMQAYDACRLIAVNLYSFVVNPFTQDAYFDFDKFYKVNYEAMRLSDNLIDLENEHMDRILEKISTDPESEEVREREYKLWQLLKATSLASRRTGLGFTALGDMLAALGYKYQSAGAKELVNEVMYTKMKSELHCTTDLAINRGTFKGWDPKLEYPEVSVGEFMECENDIHPSTRNPGNSFYANLQCDFPKEVERMMKFGRRNVSWSTAAPTGSLSMLSQTSSGIEPVFMIAYKRRKKVNANDKGARIDFVDQNGDSWQEFQVLHPKFKQWILINTGRKDVDTLTDAEVTRYFKLSPWYKATAPEIPWEDRVKMQSIIQRYISHSISSTINLPSDVSEQEVSDIYMAAWKMGLKGITVYREGSRSGVLVSNTPSKTELTKFNETHAPKRPKSLEAKVIRFNNNKEKWVAFVGTLDGKPYEIFTGKLEGLGLPGNVEDGAIIKVKDEFGIKRYDFAYDGGTVEGISKLSSADYWNYGKLISGILRHGMPLPYLTDMVSELNFEEDHINTWRNGVVRALKKFIKDGTAIGTPCPNPECDGELVFEGGCQVCKTCGHDKCG